MNRIIPAFLALAVLVVGGSLLYLSSSHLPSAGSQLAQVAAPTSGLVGHWSFDSNTNDSAGSNNGSFAGNAAYTTAGQIGGAAYLDGSSYISINDNSGTLQPTNSYSYSLWIKLDQVVQNPYAGILLKTAGDGSPQVNIQLDQTGNNIIVQHNGVTYSTGLTTNSIKGPSWHLLTVTYDGPSLVMSSYLDGSGAAVKTTTSVGKPTGAGSGPLYFGREESQPSGIKIKGYIDDVRVYNRAISGDEVRAIFNPQSIPAKPPIDLYILINDGGGTVTTGGLPLEFLKKMYRVSANYNIYTVSVVPGTNLTLTAVPSSGYNFVSWSGGLQALCIPAGTTNTSCTIVVPSSSNSIQADFVNPSLPAEPAPSLTVTSPATGANWTKGSTQTISWTVSPTRFSDATTQFYAQFMNVATGQLYGMPDAPTGGPIFPVGGAVRSANIPIPNASWFPAGQYKIKVWGYGGEGGAQLQHVENISGVFTISAQTTNPAPVITSGPTATPSSSGATITWTTDQSSDTQISYGPTTSYTSQTALVTTPVTTHTQSITGLTAGTTYHYKVLSKNSAGTAPSSDATFITSSNPTYSITLAKTGTGTGTFTLTGTGVSCTNNICTVPSGTVTTLTAGATQGSSFITFSNAGSCTSTSPCNYTPTGTNYNLTVTATFSTTVFNPTVSLTANPTSITSGNPSTLTWTSQNATTCLASGGWSGYKALNNSTGVTVTPAVNTTYTLTCGAVGVASSTASAIVTVGTGGTAWYVRPNGSTYGLGNGTSWANAFSGLNGINWTNVAAGQVIYVAAGNYTQALSVIKSGTNNTNRITIKAAQDAYTGVANLIGVGINLNSNSYVTIDGDYAGQHNILIRGADPTVIATNSGIWGGRNGTVISNVDFDNIGAAIAVSGTGIDIHHNNLTNINGGVGFSYAMKIDGGVSVFDTNKIHHNEIQVLARSSDGYGPDGIQTSSGLSVYNNKFTIKKIATNFTTSEHTDYLQAGMSNYLKIYNNEFVDDGDSDIQLGIWIDHDLSQVWVFNNIFRIVTKVDDYPEFIRMYAGINPSTQVQSVLRSVNNLKIINNTFVDNVPTANGCDSGTSGWAFCPIRIEDFNTIPTGTNNEINNNLFYNVGKGASTEPLIDIDNRFDPGPFATNFFTFSNNIYYNPSGTAYIKYNAPAITTTNWVSTKEPTAKTAQPLFKSYTAGGANNNLELLSTDTVATNAGTNKTALCTTVPEVCFDRAGNPRPATGAWDVGAYENTGIPTAPVLTVTKSGTGTGTATSSGSINCGPTCTTQTANGTAGMTVNLGINPSSGSTFGGWTITPTTTIVSGCTTTSTTCSFILNSNTTVTVLFNPVTAQNFNLTLTKTGAGSASAVTVSQTGTSCGTNCWTYPANTSVVLTATPGSYTTTWTGCTTSSGNTCNVTMNANKSVTADFSMVIGCTGTCVYIKPGGTGGGSSWTDARGWFPTPPARGTTYYVAAGDYTSYGRYIMTDVSGTSLITIKKATNADHGTDTGWSNCAGCGIGQAVFKGFEINNMGYVTLDGSYEPGMNGSLLYGFKTTSTQGQTGIWMGSNLNSANITIQYIDISGPATNIAYPYRAPKSTKGIHLNVWQANGSTGSWTNLKISHNAIHGFETLIQTYATTDMLIEYNKLYDNLTDTRALSTRPTPYENDLSIPIPIPLYNLSVDPHGNILWTQSPVRTTFRYNEVWNWDLTGVYPSANPSGVQKIYGNYFHDSVAQGSPIWFFGDVTSSDGTWLIYNNTFRTGGRDAIHGDPGATPSGEVKNNIFYSYPNTNMWGSMTHASNFYSGSNQDATTVNGVTQSNGGIGNGANPFVNTTTAQIVGTVGATYPADKATSTIGVEYSGSINGAIRPQGAGWDIGAWEYTTTIGLLDTPQTAAAADATQYTAASASSGNGSWITLTIAALVALVATILMLIRHKKRA